MPERCRHIGIWRARAPAPSSARCLRVERSRSGSLVVVTVGRRLFSPCHLQRRLLTILMLDSLVFLSSFTKEIHHGSAPRSDGTGPQTPRPQSRHHPQLPAVWPQVRRVLHAVTGATRRRRSPRLFASPDRGRTACLRQLPPGVRRLEVPL